MSSPSPAPDVLPPPAPPRAADGPWGHATPDAERTIRRRAATVVFVGCAVLLAVATYLNPASAGHGTHEQLGLPPCGWVTGFGIPCPTCGMTTAFASAADGDLLTSLRTQPMGCLLALATAAATIVSAYVMATGSAVGGHLLRLVTPRVGWGIAALVLAAWIYKIVTF